MLAQNKRKFSQYASLVNANKKSVGAGQTIVPVLVEKVNDMKSKKGNPYWFVVATSLNKTPVWVQFEDKRDKDTKEIIPFSPPNKKAKTEGAEDEADEFEQHDNSITMKNNKYGTMLMPNTQLKVNIFERSVASSLDTPVIAKFALSSDLWNERISFKVGQVILGNNPTKITKSVYNQFALKAPIGEIPIESNITVDENIPYEYNKRSFILPLSNDSEAFESVDILVDAEDSKRFTGKMKDCDDIFPSVNMDVGNDKVVNSMAVVYTKPDQTSYFFKYGYFPTVWSAFGITNVEDWQKTAGRLIFNACNWYCTGSSKLEDICRMASNSSAGNDGADYGYGEDYDTCDQPVEENSEEKTSDPISSTGFLSRMSLDLTETVKKAGIEIPFDYVNNHYGPASSFKYTGTVENKLNSGWMVSLEKGIAGTFNVTEFNDFVRPAFMNAASKCENIKFYGIFAIGDDSQYENFTEENNKPTVVFAVVG